MILHSDMRIVIGMMNQAHHAILPVYCLYVLHANRRGRTWLSLSLLSRLAGCRREAALEARRWLIEHGALERVPYSQRVGPERDHPRYEVLQVTGEISLNGTTYRTLYIPGDFLDQGTVEDDEEDKINSPAGGLLIVHDQVQNPSCTTTTTTTTANAVEPTDGDVTDAVGCVLAYYEANMGPLFPVVVEELESMVDQYGEDYVLAAIDEAVRHGVYRLSYVLSVCRSAARDGRRPGQRYDSPGPPRRLVR